MYLLYEMVPVKDDSLKHLTHKNEFLARAKWQPKVIYSSEMLTETQGGMRRRGVTWRATEQDWKTEKEGREQDEANKECTSVR